MLLTVCFLAINSCSSNSPNLPEKKLMELMNELSIKAAETSVFTFPDGSYEPSAGIKHTEIRTINKSAHPICKFN